MRKETTKKIISTQVKFSKSSTLSIFSLKLEHTFNLKMVEMEEK